LRKLDNYQEDTLVKYTRRCNRVDVYASQPLSPVATQHSLPSGRYSLLGPDFHRLDRTSFAWRTYSITSSARAPVHSRDIARQYVLKSHHTIPAMVLNSAIIAPNATKYIKISKMMFIPHWGREATNQACESPRLTFDWRIVQRAGLTCLPDFRGRKSSVQCLRQDTSLATVRRTDVEDAVRSSVKVRCCQGLE
jgi:hypothetical protein